MKRILICLLTLVLLFSTAAAEESQITPGTRVKLTMNGETVYGTVPDTAAGRAFLEKLPFSITGFRSTDDICCSVSEELESDPAENDQWTIGSFGWFGGWFTMLCDHEESFSGMNVPIVLRLDREGIETVTAMSGSIEIQVEAEDSTMSAENTMLITVDDKRLVVTLADNSSARALVELLRNGPLTVDMSDYGSMEKVGRLGTTLPTNDEDIVTGPGDVILYMGGALVIYYDRNHWDFTRLGKIEGATKEGLLEILGNGNVTVTLSLAE